MKTARSLALLMGMSLLTAGAGMAQQSTRGSGGFWGSIGGGYVALGTSCQTCGAPAYHDGLAVYVRAGGTLRPGIRLGVQVTSLTRGTDTTSVRLLIATLVGQWHPFHSQGFYLLMGYGGSGGRQDYHFNGISTRVSHGGIGLNFEVGWDLHLGAVDITPNVSANVGALGDLEPRDQSGNPFLLKDAMVTGYQFGLSVGIP